MHTKTIKRQFNAFLIPILLIYAALTLYPLIQSFIYSGLEFLVLESISIPKVLGPF
jgi:ABC-type sugar transport system permease subunit